MWYSKEYLKLCEKLAAAGLEVKFQAGLGVARGYADLGCEQFLMLDSNKMISLISGKHSDLLEDHKKYFFWVPAVEELIDQILERSSKLDSISLLDERNWKVEILDRKGIKIQESDTLLEMALGRGLFRLLADKNI